MVINLGNQTKDTHLSSSNCFVMMKLKPGYYFNNYYWLEGQLTGDQERRIPLLHSGKPHQCSLCLESVETGCLGFGNDETII